MVATVLYPDGVRPAGTGRAEALLLRDLALAAEAAAPEHLSASLAEADPLKLDLPPLPGVRAAPQVLQALSALYLAAWLEDIGIVVAAEELVRRRATLRVPPSVGARLEAMAQREGRWYPRMQRTALFARLFGLGPGVASEPGGGNARLEPLLAALCSAIVACGPRRAVPADGLHAAVAHAGLELATCAALAHTGAASVAVGPLTDQLRLCVDLISDPGIGTLVGARGFWPTLRALLGPNAPDLRRLLDCGRHGQHLLRWLAAAVPSLEPSSAVGPEITPDVVGSAAAWLTANGLAPSSPPVVRGRDGF